MSKEQVDGGLNPFRAGGIGLSIIGGLALVYLSFFIKDPGELPESNQSRINADAADRSLLRERVSVLERELARTYEQGFSDRFTGTQGQYERSLTDLQVEYERKLTEQADMYLLERINEVDDDVDELRRRMKQ